MTAASSRRPRRSKRTIRVWAYAAGAVSFATPWVVLNAVPRPPASAGTQSQQQAPTEIRKITRRIVIVDPPNAPAQSGPPQVRYVYTGGSSGSSGGGGGVRTKCSTC